MHPIIDGFFGVLPSMTMTVGAGAAQAQTAQRLAGTPAAGPAGSPRSELSGDPAAPGAAPGPNENSCETPFAAEAAGNIKSYRAEPERSAGKGLASYDKPCTTLGRSRRSRRYIHSCNPIHDPHANDNIHEPCTTLVQATSSARAARAWCRSRAAPCLHKRCTATVYV